MYVLLVVYVMAVDWVSISVVSLYIGRRNKYECTSFRGPNLLSVMDKIYGKVLVKKIGEGTERMICDEQSVLRK